MSLLDAFFVKPWPWWGAGLAVGIFVTVLAGVTGKALSVSSGFGTVCSACAPGLSYFRQKPYTDRWRLWFILGIPLGGLAGAALAGRVGVRTDMGAFDLVLSSNLAVKFAILFAGGALVGFGARWADG